MIHWDKISEAAAAECLFISGVLDAKQDDPVPAGTVSILLLSPDEPAFWAHFQSSPEAADGQVDPLDRWTVAAAARIKQAVPDATALFPFGGPPWQPFIQYSQRSGRTWQSPVGLLVHDTMGLFASFRAALTVPYHVEQPAHQAQPCPDCAQPCLSACPVKAFSDGSYDVPICKSYLNSSDGAVCRDGCLVRRACPVGQGRRKPAQSAFHMKAFM